jgi:hypothetical protein
MVSPHIQSESSAAQSTRSQQLVPSSPPRHESSNQSHPLLNPTGDSPLLTRDLRLLDGAESRGPLHCRSPAFGLTHA